MNLATELTHDFFISILAFLYWSIVFNHYNQSIVDPLFIGIFLLLFRVTILQPLIQFLLNFKDGITFHEVLVPWQRFS
jgi:putative effector of murein hydrolase